MQRSGTLLLCLVLVGFISATSSRADQTWDGGGVDAFWNTAANWGGDTLPNFGSAINFGGTIQTTTNNNLTADTTIGGINFTNTTSGQAFTLNGNRIRLGGNIVTSTLTGGVSSASITDIINMDLVLTGTRTITAAASSTNGNHHVTINGIISETGGSFGFTKNGTSGGILTLSALNTFTGTITLTSGTISFNTIADAGTASSLGAGGTIITGDSNGSAGTLLYTGSGNSTNRQIQIGTGSTTSTIGTIIQNDGSGALTFSNTNFNALFATSTATKTLTIQGTSAASNTISGIIADNNTAGGGIIALTKDNSGTWVLAGLNTFSGQVRINQGTLSVNSVADTGTASALGTGANSSVLRIASSTGGNATLLYTGAGGSTNRQVQIGSGSTSTASPTIQADGSGALRFTNANFNASDTSVTSTAATRTLTLQGSSTAGNEVLGIISDNVGSATAAVSLTKSGTGSWLLSGQSTFTGQVRVDNGTLSVASIANSGGASALGIGTVNSVINIGSSSNTGTLIFTGGTNSTTNRQVQIGRSTTSTGGAVIQNDGAGTLTFSNSAFNTSDTTVTNTSAARTLTLQGTNTGANTISGVIANNVGSGSVVGAITLVKAGAGSWTLAGANTYTGGTSLSAGTLNVNNAGSGGTSSALGTSTLTITGGAIDNTSGGALTLSTANAVAFNGNFTFNGSNDLTIGGVISIGGASRSLTMNNGKTLTFGQLQWSSDLDRTLTVTQGTGTGSKLVLGGFQLNTLSTATAARTRTIAGTTNVSITGPVVDGNSFANNLAYSGTATLTLSAASTYTGTTSVTGGGVLDVGTISSGALAGGGLIFSNNSVLQGNGTFTRDFSSLVTAASNQISGATGGFSARGGTLTVNIGGAGNPVLLSAGNYRFGTNFVFGSSTADSPVIVVNPLSTNGNFIRTFTVNPGEGGDYAELQGGITDTGSIVKEGAGRLILTGTNTVTGSLTINAGSVQIGLSTTNSGTTGTVPFSGIVNNGSLVFARSDALSYGNVISGTGSLTQDGAGTTSITGTSTYTGATTINAGTLQIGAGGTTGSINSSSGVTNNATLVFNRTNTLVFTPAITGTGVVNQIGAGITNLSGTNTYSGGTNVTSGTLTFLNTNARPATGATTVSAGATLGLGVANSGSFFTSSDVDSLFAGTLSNVSNDAASIVGIDTSAGDFIYATSVSGTTRGLNKLGANTLTITGNNSYSGATIVSGGVLRLDSATAISGGIANTGGSSLISFNGGVIGLTAASGNFTRSLGSGAGQVRWLSGATGGFAAYGGDRTVNFGGNSTPSQVSWFNGGTQGVFGTALVLSDSSADSTVTVLNPIALNNAASNRTITVNDGSAAIDAVLAGVISSSLTANNGTRIIKNGAGTLALTAANSYVSGSSFVGTTISAGTLMLGNGGSTGSLLYIPSTGGGSIINSDVTIASGATFAFNRSDTGLTVANLITGAGKVAQVGSGRTTVSNANTYSGGTSVSAGTLLVSNTTGSATGTGGVTIAAGTTLGGTGIIAPTGSNSVIIGGALAPGLPGTNNGVGTLTLTPVDGNVTFQNGSSATFHLLSNGSNDRVVFNASGAGVLDFSAMAAGSISVSFAGGYTPVANDSFDLLDWAAVSGAGITGLSASLLNLSAAALDPSLFWDTSQFSSTGVIFVAVPEPSRMLLIASGLAGYVLRRRRSC